MATVELIYDHDCPNVATTRSQLLKAFAAAKLSPRWLEWERSDSASPHYAQAYGSPTVLIDGTDVAGAKPSKDATCCRLYTDPSGGMSGTPPVAAILEAMQDALAGMAPAKPPRKSGWLSSLATLPGIAATLLPVGMCPACWPAYAGVLGALGVGFLLKTSYLLPVTALFLLVAVGALVVRARSRRGYAPFALGLVASAIVLIGKFVFLSDVAMYGGVALLASVSIWNAWPQKATGVNDGTCPACAPEGQVPDSQQPGAKEVSS